MLEKGEIIIDLGMGNSHTVLLTNFGNVYVCGCNRFGQLGLKPEMFGNINEFIRIEDIPKISKIFVGNIETLLLSESYDLYYCGSNNRLVSSISDLKKNKNLVIKEVAIGAEQYCFLFENSDLIFINRHNAGSENYFSANEKEPKFYVKCLMSKSSTFLLSSDGEVFAKGNNGYGQLGVGHYEEVSKLTKVPGLPKIIKIAASNNYTMFLSERNEIFASGYKIKSMESVGSEKSKAFSNKTLKIIGMEKIKVKDIFAERDGLYLTTIEDSLYTIFDTFEDEKAASLVAGIEIRSVDDFKNVKAFVSNKDTFLILTKLGNLYAKGQNNRGMLGVSEKNLQNYTKIVI